MGYKKNNRGSYVLGSDGNEFTDIPETPTPKIGPKKKFHAQCIPIGTHRLFRNLYAAANINPASTETAIAVQKSTVVK